MVVQVVVVGNLAEDAGRMFGLDVRATDRNGDAAGRSAIANLFVSKAGMQRVAGVNHHECLK